MARKYDLISELYDRTCASVSENPLNWQGLLRTASYNFRLRFDEQLLLYAQRPDATAVLPIERWNGSFGRWVNRGAKGIAVFEDENRQRQRLTHYFDISDTHGSRYARPVPLWQMKLEYESDVAETLENTFGEADDNSTLESIIEGCVGNAVDDNIADYLADLQSLQEGSVAQSLLPDAARDIYTQLVKQSVAYMITVRLGLDTSRYSAESFMNIGYFNTPEMINAVGFATSDIAEMGLTEIARTINALEKQNRIIAAENHSDYNRNENNERSNDNGRNHLFDGGRLQSSEPENAGAPNVNLGRWAQMRRSYLRDHHKILYYNLLTKGTLTQHLAEVQQRATEMEETLVRQMAQKEGLTEELKATDMMKWVRLMNNLRNSAQEVVKAEVIFA